MTVSYEEFKALPDFDLVALRSGRKVVCWTNGTAAIPLKQDYYEGHPSPLVLKCAANEEPLMYRERDIHLYVRMVPKDRYEVQIFGSADDPCRVLIYFVVDTEAQTDKEIGEFYKQELADDYAKYLNLKDIEDKRLAGENTAIMLPNQLAAV